MTMFVFALLGGMIGLAVLQEFGGFVIGAALGALAGRLSELTSRIRLLERRLDAQRAAEARSAASEARGAAAAARETAEEAPSSAAAMEIPVEAAAAPLSDVSPPSAPLAPEPPPEVVAARETAPEPVPAPSSSTAPSPKPSLAELARARRTQALAAGSRRAVGGASVDAAADSGGLGAFVETLFRWFTTGNVPVKVGVVLSVFGVGFLVKEGIDRHWLVLPLEVRLALVAVFGVALLGVGWRLRRSKPAYALSVQGGGIAVLYLTIYASYALYSLLPSVAAFGALVLVTAAAGTLAVLQDSRALAVLGIVGGFMAPVLTSSGSGDHVALFSYYAVLNVAILAIAWFKSWRVLNVLGFAFTFGIATLWGADAYLPEKFGTTEPFLVVFVLFYLAIPVLFATRQPPELRGFVDGTLVFGTPIVGFALQSQLVADTEYGLALSAVALAMVYVLLATFLYRRRSDELRVLVEAQLALAVAFVTVAIPLALDARWTSAAWALQGAALVWLGFRQRRRLALVAGVGLQGLSGWQYFEQGSVVADWPVLNGLCLGALLLAFAATLSSRWFDPERARPESDLDVRDGLATFMSSGLLLWALGWWLYAGFTEIDRQVAERYELAAALLFVAATAWLALGVAARWHWRRIASVALLPWPVAIFGAAIAPFGIAHPSEALGWLAWPATLATMLGVLRLRESEWPRLAALLHAATYWLAAALLVWEARWHVGNYANGVWPDATTLVVGALLVSLTVRARERIAWPLAAHADVYVRVAAGGVVALLLLGAVTANVASSGDATPLQYVPLLNPLELASMLVLLVALRWASVLEAEGYASLPAGTRGVGAALFVWLVVTMAVARAVHHFAGVPFDADSLAASTTFQSALSIVWGVAGLSAMLVGTRSARRLVWFAGAGLMAVVVAKLFLVDLGNTGTLARVVSFLGVGLLLLVVGYFAPVPPRLAAANAQPGSNA